MISLNWAIGVIISLSLAVFVTFFGRLPIYRRTPIGFIYRFIWTHIPDILLSIDRKFTSGRISSSLSKFGHFLMHDRHPSVVIFFLTLMVVGEYLFVPVAWHLVSPFIKFTMALTIFLPYLFLYLCCAADPGYITPENHAYHMSLYPYDHALFHPGAECRTCGFLKPPRSKHCGVCKRCIAKADHHCIFINSCVGYGNQHWFILLLLSTAILCTYGSLLGASLLSSSIKQNFVEWSPWYPQRHGWGMYAATWGWGIQTNVGLGSTALLAGMTGPLVWGLLIYTLYLAYCGTTTNESYKWSIYKDDMDDGFAFRRRLSAKRLRNLVSEPLCPRWPVEPETVLATTDDGQPPSANMQLAGDGHWERVWKLKDAENLYDLGLWDNLVDIFVTDYKFGATCQTLPIERRRPERCKNK